MSTSGRVPTTLSLLLLFLFASLAPMLAPVSENAEAAVVGERHIYTFADGSTEAIALYQGGIPDKSVKIALPKGAEVTNATITLSGASSTGWSQVTDAVRDDWFAGTESAVDDRSDDLTLGLSQPTERLDGHGAASEDGTGQSWLDNGTFSIRQPHTSNATESRFSDQSKVTHTLGSYTGAVISYRGWYIASRWDARDIQQTLKKLYVNNGSAAGNIKIDEGSCNIPSTGTSWSDYYGIRDMTITDDERVFAILAMRRSTTDSTYHRIVEFDVRYLDTWRCVSTYEVHTGTWGDYVGISYDRVRDTVFVAHSSKSTIVAYEFNGDGTFDRDTDLAFTYSLGYSGVQMKGLAVHGDVFHIRRSIHSSEGGTSYRDNFLEAYARTGTSTTLSVQTGKTRLTCPGYGMHYDGDRIVTFDDAEGGWRCPTTHVREVGSAIQYSISPTPGTTSWTSAPITTTEPVIAVNMETSWSITSAGDRVDYWVSADNGTHWVAVESNTTIHFDHPGTQLRWKLTLVGASAVSWWVSMEYTTRYTSAGEWTSPITQTGSLVGRMRPQWVADVPAETTLQVEISNNNGTDWVVAASNQLIELSERGNQLLYRITMTTSNRSITPEISSFVLEYEEGYPSDVRLDLGDDTIIDYQGVGLLNNPLAVSSAALVDALNAHVPSNGIGSVEIPIVVSASSPGRVRLSSLDITYRLQTRVLDANLDGAMLVPDGAYRTLVVRSAIGDQANDIRRVEVELINSDGPNPKVRWDGGDSCSTIDDGGGVLNFDTANCTSLFDSTNQIVSVRLPIRATWAWDDEVGMEAIVSVNDDVGPAVAGWTTEDLDLRVENDVQLTQLTVTDETGRVLNNHDWLRGGFNFTFEGGLAFQDTSIAPPAGLFNLTITGHNVTQDGDPLESPTELHRERNPAHGNYRLMFQSPVESSPGGMVFKVGAVDLPNGSSFANPDRNTIRLILDGNSPLVLGATPADGAEVHKGSPAQPVTLIVQDSVDPPTSLTLHYWVEHDHDTNFNGLPEESEYLTKTIASPEILPGGLNIFSGTIDDGLVSHLSPDQVHGNRISYYVTGADSQNNALAMGGGPVCPTAPPSCGDAPGFVEPDWDLDVADYRLREEFVPEVDLTNSSIVGHDDDLPLHPGIGYQAQLRVVDKNGWQDLTRVVLALSGDVEDDEGLIVATFDGDEVSFSSEGRSLAVSNLYSTHTPINATAVDLTIQFQLTWQFPEAFESGPPSYTPRIIVEDTPCREGELVPCNTVDTNFLGDDTWFLDKDLRIDMEDGHFTAVELTTGRDLFTRGAEGEALVGAGQVLRISGRVLFSDDATPAPSGSVEVVLGDVEREWRTTPGEAGMFSMDMLVPSVRSGHLDLLARLDSLPGGSREVTATTPRLRLAVDGVSPEIVEVSPQGAVSLAEIDAVPLRLETADISGFDEDDPPVLHYVVRAGTSEVARGSYVLSLAQSGDSWLWSGSLDLTDGGATSMLPGYTVEVWVTGSDGAGNPYPALGNTERDPLAIWELTRDGAWVDTDEVVLEWSDPTPMESTSVELRGRFVNRGAAGPLSFSLEQETAAGWTPIEVVDHTFADGDTKTLVFNVDVPEWRASESVMRFRMRVLDGDVELNRTHVDPLFIQPSTPESIGAAAAQTLEQDLQTVLVALIAIVGIAAFAVSLVRGNKWRQRALEGDDPDDVDVPGADLPPPAPPSPSMLAGAMDQTAMVMADLGTPPPPDGMEAPDPEPTLAEPAASPSLMASNGWSTQQIADYYAGHGVDMTGWEPERIVEYYEDAVSAHASGGVEA